MSFNSLSYLSFFPLVLVLFFSLPHRLRWALLLGASCYFYMVFVPAFILVLAFTIVVDYFAGILIEASDSARLRRGWLIASLVANGAMLFVFKYFNFFSSGMTSVFGLSLPALRLLLPIGLSFHTFQAMAYTIEVYRGRQKAERHFGIYALYVMFFPQLVAGPIERPQNLLHQFHEERAFSIERLISGLRLVLLGFFKKVVVADGLADFVDYVYGTSHGQPAFNLILATAMFSFQIYYDFSGYTDIARGSARMLGFELSENFRMPYFSESVSEFWRRWNITLSSWFRDYVYIPLGGGRVAPILVLRNLFLVFILSGLWHGASLTFVAWGALHFVYVSAERFVSWRLPLPKFLRVFKTFVFVSLAWIFFRAPSLDAAYEIFQELIFFQHTHIAILWTYPGLLLALVLLVCTVATEMLWLRGLRTAFWSSPQIFRWSAYYAMLLGLFCFGTFDHSRFIYFQF